MKIPPTTVRHNVGTCPACRDYLWAEVDIEVNVSEPTMTREGVVIVNTSPTLVGMAVAHSCWRDAADERQSRNTGQLGDLGDIAQALRDAAQEARERGDIGRPGEVEVWDWLERRADQFDERYDAHREAAAVVEEEASDE